LRAENVVAFVSLADRAARDAALRLDGTPLAPHDLPSRRGAGGPAEAPRPILVKKLEREGPTGARTGDMAKVPACIASCLHRLLSSPPFVRRLLDLRAWSQPRRPASRGAHS
jgi:hypothetical protein